MRSWPLCALVLSTPRLQLRLPSDDELDQLAVTSVGRVLLPEQAEYIDGGWTQLGSPDYERAFVQHHWRVRADWRPDSWMLVLVAFDGDRPIGCFSLAAEDFGQRRCVRTGSWLLPDRRRRGLGTEGRGAILHLAFAELSAAVAVSPVHPDNRASRGVSRAFGYEAGGTLMVSGPNGRLVPRIQLRLTRPCWLAGPRPEVRVEGVQRSRSLFGLE
jgi:RimJ/RimL family protein N-acetyltransferase